MGTKKLCPMKRLENPAGAEGGVACWMQTSPQTPCVCWPAALSHEQHVIGLGQSVFVVQEIGSGIEGSGGEGKGGDEGNGGDGKGGDAGTGGDGKGGDEGGDAGVTTETRWRVTVTGAP